jgi:hypothetical protein
MESENDLFLPLAEVCFRGSTGALSKFRILKTELHEIFHSNCYKKLFYNI